VSRICKKYVVDNKGCCGLGCNQNPGGSVYCGPSAKYCNITHKEYGKCQKTVPKPHTTCPSNSWSHLNWKYEWFRVPTACKKFPINNPTYLDTCKRYNFAIDRRCGYYGEFGPYCGDRRYPICSQSLSALKDGKNLAGEWNYRGGLCTKTLLDKPIGLT